MGIDVGHLQKCAYKKQELTLVTGYREHPDIGVTGAVSECQGAELVSRNQAGLYVGNLLVCG